MRARKKREKKRAWEEIRANIDKRGLGLNSKIKKTEFRQNGS
jgi:hypothetical protein